MNLPAIPSFLKKFFHVNSTNYQLPIFILLEIASSFHEKIVIGIDTDELLYLYIPNLDRLKRRKFLSDLTGRGPTLYDASMDFLRQVMDPLFTIRYKKKYYATTKLRSIVKKTGLLIDDEDG